MTVATAQTEATRATYLAGIHARIANQPSDAVVNPARNTRDGFTVAPRSDRDYAAIVGKPYPLSWLIDDVSATLSKCLHGVSAASIGKALTIAVKLAGAQGGVHDDSIVDVDGVHTARTLADGEPEARRFRGPAPEAPREWLEDTVHDCARLWLENAGKIATADNPGGLVMTMAQGIGHNRYRAWQRRAASLDVGWDGDDNEPIPAYHLSDADFTAYIDGAADAARLWSMLPLGVKDAAKTRMQGRPLTPAQRKCLSRYAATLAANDRATVATAIVRDVLASRSH